MDRDFLKKISLFAELPDDDLDKLALELKQVTFAAHRHIFWMDELGETLFIVQGGHVQISYTDEKGQDVVLSTLRPGDFFGELSLIDGGPHTATARALTDTILLTLDRSSFYRFIGKHPLICRALLNIMARRLRSNVVKLRGIPDINEQIEESTSLFQKVIDKVAKAVTSAAFLSVCMLFIFIWMVVQVYVFQQTEHEEISFLDKPPTFFLLGFIFTLTSFLFTVLILNSQRRQAESDRIRNTIEYQVNLKAQGEVMKLKLKMDKVLQLLNKISGKELLEEEQETVL